MGLKPNTILADDNVEPLWKAGVARAIITPETPVWLAGYGTRRIPEGKLHDLWLKSLAIEDSEGRIGVLVTSDFQGIPKSFSDRVFARLKSQLNLNRNQVMLTFSHNHCGPRLGDDLIDYYPVDIEQEALIDEYTDKMIDLTVETVAASLSNRVPATLQQGQGTATFAVNRRNNREADVPDLIQRGIPLVGPVDHSVPVMTVNRSDGTLMAILFGYACHPTTLSFTQWCGDFPGYAQIQLERAHPTATAMFVNTCGGDQNPLPRRTVELCERYGKMLADGVESALQTHLSPISARLNTAFRTIDLDYLKTVSLEDLEAAEKENHAIRARWASRLKKQLQSGMSFPTSYPYPIHAWKLGDETLLIGMGAETVVDYALRFKSEFKGTTWVCGYTDDMIAYIPSRRVWEEGGYEGGSNLFEYGRPAFRWAGDIEDRISTAVHELVDEVSGKPAISNTPDDVKWNLVTPKAKWQARDSAGELVLNNRLWIMGGWFDSYSAPPRDVWSSEDGKSWKLANAEAPWKHSDLPMTTSFDNRMWIMGGWYNGRLEGHGATNEVWSSSDGEHWNLESSRAEWSPRLAAGLVSFKDRLWLLGGIENYYFGDQSSLKNDVWSSADGKTWHQVTANAPWSPRAYHQAVVHDGRIWVMGGGNYVPEYQAHNDVWCSTDGVNWQLITESADWPARLWFSAVTWRQQMWVVGGWSNNPSRNWGDVWHSNNGKTWKLLNTPMQWKERHEHSAWVFQDKLWVGAGHAQPLSSEVWNLTLPPGWPD